MRIVAPVGSAPAPKSWSRATDPSTATFAARATSLVREERARTAAATTRMSGSSALVPCTCVFQLPCSDDDLRALFRPGAR